MLSNDYFKGKRIAVVGLGAHAEMVKDIEFLTKAGAWVSLYDLKSESRLKDHLLHLRSIGLANYVCGSIPADDLLDMDLIILSHEYPKDSSFLKEVNVPIEYPETLFFRLAPPVTLVGIMGTGGKSTVMTLLYPLLQHACEKQGSQKSFLIDPDSKQGTLTYLKKVKTGDIVIMKISGHLMPDLYSMRISPHVAIFTSIPSIDSYNTSPFEILEYQTHNNFIVASDEVIDATRMMKFQPRAKMLRTKASYIPSSWRFSGNGSHDASNASLALQAAHLFKIDNDTAEKTFLSWKSLKGRIEPIKKVKGFEWYNDGASSHPDAVLIALQALNPGGKGILIFGGTDAGYDYRALYSELPKYIHTLVTIPGSGTILERQAIREIENITVHASPSIETAVSWVVGHAQKGDMVIFSPGFLPGGLDNSKKTRGERFVRAVRNL